MTKHEQGLGNSQELDAEASILARNIALKDFLVDLKRRKWLFFGVVVTITGLSLLAGSLVEPVFKSRAVVGLSAVGGFGYVEEPRLLVERVKEKHGLHDFTRLHSYPELVSAELVENSGDSLLELETHGVTPGSAKDFLSTVVGEIVEHQNELYKGITSLKLSHRSELSRQLVNLEQGQTALEDKAHELEDQGQASILLLQWAALRAHVSQIRAQLNDLELQLTPSRTYPATVVRAPTEGNRRANAGLGVFGAVGLAMGFLFGIVVVLVSALLAQVRKS